ncbi:MAG: class I SAM-dependent methyltransferase [Candidatus Dadabacteria bacterium]|nr:MAG: class I SAM-dependent methyltransferase [Candidatus Dadabacteria bacterium]
MSRIGSATLVKEGRRERFDRYFYGGCRRAAPRPGAPGERVLDLGCGQGEMARFFRDLGFTVVGVDVAETNVARLRELGFEAHRADLNEPLLFPDAWADGVCLLDVIEHVVKAEHLVGECRRVLRPEGWLLLSTPNHAFYKRRLRALQGRAPDEEGYHFRFFIRRKLRALLEREGFRIERRCSIGYYPLMNRLLLRRLRGLQRLRVPVPAVLETLFAENFVWLLRKAPER